MIQEFYPELQKYSNFSFLIKIFGPIPFEKDISNYLEKQLNSCDEQLLILDLTKQDYVSSSLAWSGENDSSEKKVLQFSATQVLFAYYNLRSKQIIANKDLSPLMMIERIMKCSDESSLISILHSNFFLTNDMTNKPKERPFKNEFFRVLSFMYTFYHLLNVLSASQSDFSHVLSILYTLLDDFNSTNQYIGGFLLLLFFQKTNSLKIKVFSSNDQVEMCKDILNRTFQHCSQKNTDENELQNNLIFVLLTCYYEFYKQQPLSQNRTLSIQEVLCNIFQLLKRCK